MICFEDLERGAVATHGACLVEREEMVAFARAFDPQPFHLDEVAAQASPVGRLIASGWYSAAVQMRLLCEGLFLRACALGGAGLEEMRWLRPVAAGDILSVRWTVLDKRTLASRPDRGLVRLGTELVDAQGRSVLAATHRALFGRREPGDASPTPRRAHEPDPAPPVSPEDPARAARYYEEVELGRRVELGTTVFTAADIVSFAQLYDPQPFHLDEAAAARGPFGRLAASGWHTAASWMALFVARQDRIEAAGGRPVTGVSPGLRDLAWLRPVFAGDAIRYTSEPIEKRPLATRPGWGLVSGRNEGWNQAGEKVFGFVGSALWRMRDA